MWAVAAQPQTGLTPMIPTPSVDSDMARVESYSKLEASAGVELNRSEARPTTVSGAFGVQGDPASELDDAVLQARAQLRVCAPKHLRLNSSRAKADHTDPIATTFRVPAPREASRHSFTPQGAASPYRKLPVSRNGQGQRPQVDLIVREGCLRYRHLRPDQPLTSPQLAVGIELWIPASIQATSGL